MGLALIQSNVSIHATYRLWTSEHPSDLLCLNFRLWLHVIYLYMHKYELRSTCEMYGVNSAIRCKTVLVRYYHAKELLY
jgi:hypothetical protein